MSGLGHDSLVGIIIRGLLSCTITHIRYKDTANGKRFINYSCLVNVENRGVSAYIHSIIQNDS